MEEILKELLRDALSGKTNGARFVTDTGGCRQNFSLTRPELTMYTVEGGAWVHRYHTENGGMKIEVTQVADIKCVIWEKSK